MIHKVLLAGDALVAVGGGGTDVMANRRPSGDHARLEKAGGGPPSVNDCRWTLSGSLAGQK